ncbi:hypothetical protein ACTQ3Y_07310 [Segatella copri]|uniref:hypothetical protein n=1 Tax=Segatella copri TaxID=165179 RepID=UPI003F9BBC07
MAQSNVNMSKLKRSSQMLAAKIPQRTICEQLHMGRGVLNRYKTLADSQGLTYGVIGRMSDGEIESFLQLSKPTAAPSSQRQVLDGLLPEYVSDLSHNRYLIIQALHESYKKEHPDGYGYTQFKKSIREYQYSHNLSFHNTYIPGEEMQIDFAGDALWLTDPKTGELTKFVVLVCILPYSGLGFAKAMYNASMENFFGGISEAFFYFGGTTPIAIHQRHQGPGYSTLDEHMPDKHLAHKHRKGYNAAYFLEEGHWSAATPLPQSNPSSIARSMSSSRTSPAKESCLSSASMARSVWRRPASVWQVVHPSPTRPSAMCWRRTLTKLTGKKQSQMCHRTTM